MRRSLKSRPTWRPSLLIAFHLHNPPVVTWGAVKGAPEQGAFILTLDSSPRHFILELGTKRNAVQLSFVPQWIRFSVRIGTPSAMLPNCLPLSFPFVRRSTLIGASYPCVSQSLACNHHSYPGFYPHSQGATWGPVHVGVRSQTRPHHNRDGA